VADDPPPSETRRVSSFAFVPLTELEHRTYKFLLVDDDPDSLMLLQRGLAHAKDFACENTLAHDAQEARKAMVGKTFDAVIADQVMPGQNGIDFLMEVREHSPETLRILITAYPSLGAVLRAVNLAQVHTYLEKPYDPRALNRALSEALLRRQERSRTEVFDVHNVGEAVEMLRGFESESKGAQSSGRPWGVTFSFDSSVDFNRFTFEVLQARASAIRDVHVFEGKFHVTLSVQPSRDADSVAVAA
jgi:response regulator RpfG family c-di-GMP phosphodiesterase